MGSLMPVGSGPDAEIIAALNNIFSGKNLATLRDHKNQTGESLFDKNHKLRRVAFRLGAYPARDYSPVDDAKRKWFYFLHQVLPPATEKAIKRVLNNAISSNSPVTAVQFFVEENKAASEPHLYPYNTASLASFLDPTGKYYWVRLIVKKQLDDVGEDQPDKPNDHDKDDNGNDVEHPINWPAFRLKHSVFAKKTQKPSTRSRKPK
jgi:hypothetical protein